MAEAGTRRPSSADLEAAAGGTVPDVIAPRLTVLFCGINPGLWSAAVGHHFARPGNRFWKVLHAAGFTTTVLDPADEASILRAGLGITNLVPRATATASELTSSELRDGVDHLEQLVREIEPGYLACLGMVAYRTAFRRPRAEIGEQPELLGNSRVWLLPNPSGLQARYQMPELVDLFSELRIAAAGSARADKAGADLLVDEHGSAVDPIVR
ncbi:MAG: G/U mismatch-specific DNA glycosylase [Acidimicrobiales bacterium]